MSLKHSNPESNYVQRGRFYGPVYDVDHLATFEVGPKNGLLTAEDGMRKLRIMEKSQGVWTMSCQILIDTKYIVLYDKKTREELDLFPIDLISEPTSVSIEDKTDPFNNVLLFTVLEDLKKNKSINSEMHPTEMHLFQCKKENSTEVVDEIYKAIDTLAFNQNAKINKSHESTTDSMRKYQQSLDDNNNNTQMNSHPKIKPNVDHDLKLLNSCFDYIEQFVTLLQNSSEQYKELEKKKKIRKSKQKHSGDGLLEKRAQLPQPAQFTDVFQKIKFSFNLLAKLKTHIHDPNAPELVHFLFTPLALIVNAAKDEAYRDVSKKIWQPLLTKDAKDLLMNCLSSKEQDLWMSLGECWVVTKEEIKLQPHAYPNSEINQIYRPVFSDGSSPDFVDAKTEIGRLAYETAAQAQANNQRYQQSQIVQPQNAQKPIFQQAPQIQRTRNYINEDDTPHSANSVIKPNQNRVNFSHPGGPTNNPVVALHSAQAVQQPASANSLHNSMKTSQIRNYEEMKKWAIDLKLRGAKVYEVKSERQANNEKELSVKGGELVEVLDDKRNWWRLRNFYGLVGHAPVTILRPFEFSD
ncbi:unnamed protein product [Brachionus calyciflorus]|uniref:SH3 domain-containing protein n=1 Tax=Brachionus calyciflorus TaxID=104777 RepID=A0A813QRT0_9BILA|nr:unnamed protein product [Brachionus calyciflorus]